MKISVVMPVYEMKGRGVEFLTQALDSLALQTCTNFEVIISDHSVSDNIEQLCQTWTTKLPLVYKRYTKNHGLFSANINHGMQLAKGEWIKPLFQDDYLYNQYSLQHFLAYTDTPNCSWIASGCVHINENLSQMCPPKAPRYTPKIAIGENTLGCPSVVMFKNTGIRFDPKVKWLMDCDLYTRLFALHGAPALIPQPMVAVRIWKGSQTSALEHDGHTLQNELDYLKNRPVSFANDL